MPKALLQVQQLTLDGLSGPLLSELDLQVSAGQSWAVVGQNGVGKSTLLRALCGLHAATGCIDLCSRNLDSLSPRKRARCVGLLSEADQPSFPLSVHQSLLGACYSRLNWFGNPAAEDAQLLQQTLTETALQSLRDKPLDQLSAGEQRRVAIARLLVQKPQLALVDEPVNHLDMRRQLEMMDLLKKRFQNSSQALLVVLHDVRIALRYCSHVLMLFDNGQWQAGPISLLQDKQTIRKLYGLSRHQSEILFDGS
ncbi:MAG: ABC transporter ATP-binding protein [gamma proteobacterium symbiont of Bathyaustriella thionipta]|nr:ABC transporter ATP-binding protein [gamma proteobacterium symbiont of Bathyaustriella thionipta]